MNSPTNQNGIPLVLLVPCGHYPAGIWPWAKIQIVPPVNIPIPTKIGSKLGGEFTYQPKWDPIGFTNPMWTLPRRNMAMGQNPNRTPSEHPPKSVLNWVVNSPTNQNGIPFILLIPCGHFPPVNIPKISSNRVRLGDHQVQGAKKGGQNKPVLKYPPGIWPWAFQNPNRTPSEHPNPHQNRF